jgi:hypothetical protein
MSEIYFLLTFLSDSEIAEIVGDDKQPEMVYRRLLAVLDRIVKKSAS